MNWGRILCFVTGRHKLRYKTAPVHLSNETGTFQFQRIAYCTLCGLTRPVKRRKEKAA